MEYKLKNTASKDAFNYKYLLGKIFPYIKPVLGRILKPKLAESASPAA